MKIFIMYMSFNVSFPNSPLFLFPPCFLFSCFLRHPYCSFFARCSLLSFIATPCSLVVPLLSALSLLVAPYRFSVIAHLLFATTLRYVFVSFFLFLSIFSLECIPRLFDLGSISTYLRGGHSHGGHHGQQ